MVKHIDEKQFDAITTEKNGAYVVDFWAPWCGPCKMLAPVFDAVSEKFADVKFCKVNTDENQALAMKLRISAIPTLIFIQDGEITARHSGFMTEHDLSLFVEENKA